eukprot:1599171-Rhodomonas_salina.1
MSPSQRVLDKLTQILFGEAPMRWECGGRKAGNLGLNEDSSTNTHFPSQWSVATAWLSCGVVLRLFAISPHTHSPPLALSNPNGSVSATPTGGGDGGKEGGGRDSEAGLDEGHGGFLVPDVAGRERARGLMVI